MLIARITLTEVFIPYRPPVGPYVGRHRGGEYRGTQGATGLIARLETSDGLVGWGEGSGSFGCDVNAVLAGHHAADVQGAVAKLRRAGSGAQEIAAVEMAQWDALGKRAGLPVCRLLGGVVREEADFCACMGIKEPAASAETARAYIEEWGFRYIKTKAGDDPEQDLRIAAAIQEEIGEEAVLRPDANAGYAPDVAERQMRGMRDLGVSLFEDPCDSSHIALLAKFRSEIGMGILVNMGIADPASITPLVTAGAADFLMPDTTASGGVLAVKQVTEAASAWDVPCLMHCGHDFGLKTAAVAHIAACTPGFSGPSDTCYHGLTDDILVEPLRFEGGRIRVPMEPGLGVTVDEEKLDKYRR
jgi:L-alanine-DL-glutamate epimerase-like enolase superfamily enzyme